MINIRNIKRFIVPFSLGISSITLTYLFLELIFPRLLLLLPLKTHGYLDEGIQVLSQYSKRSIVPDRYIAIVGDSNAAGKGDWFLASNNNKKPAYHSAHIIHERTGKDVITFGASGSGSLRGIVAEPISQYSFINAHPRFELMPPELIIVYFYEGNDLNDNLSDIRLRYFNGYKRDRIYDTSYFRDFIQERVHYKDPVFIRSRNLSTEDHLIFAKFMFRLVKSFIKKNKGNSQTNKKIPRWTAGNVNKVLIDGVQVSIPDKLQSPALELTSNEISLSVYVFEQSLVYLQKYFPTSKIGVVYIPSPLSSYKIASKKVSIRAYEKRNDIYGRDFVHMRSNMISALIEKVTRDNSMAFIDSTKYIMEASSRDIIHGPLDWKHFNKNGYIALSEAVIELIESIEKGQDEDKQ